MKRAAVIATAGLAVGGALGAFYQYVFGREPGVLSVILDRKGHHADYYEHRDSDAQRLRQDNSCLRFTTYSPEGLELRGFYYPCGEAPCGKIAFLVHGYRSEHAEAAGMYREYYRSRGFDLFCCDNRACGESGGQLVGYGVYESGDCLRWIDFLRRRFGSDIQIALHGFSMGGATVLLMSDRVPENVRFIVSDCGFSAMRALLKPRLGPLYWPLRLVNDFAAGYDFAAADVRPHLLRAKTPVLFIHGCEDRTVPTWMGRELYALCPTQKDCLFVENARHVESFHRAPEAYAEKLDGFIGRYFS